jgi:hypothetical protein
MQGSSPCHDAHSLQATSSRICTARIFEADSSRSRHGPIVAVNYCPNWVWYCGVVMSGEVTCPQAMSRESHRTRNENKQTKQTHCLWLSLHFSLSCAPLEFYAGSYGDYEVRRRWWGPSERISNGTSSSVQSRLIPSSKLCNDAF